MTRSDDNRQTPTTGQKEIDMKRHHSTWALVVALALMLAGLGVAAMAQSTVTWTNHDDIPHTVVSVDKVFKSKVLDTDEKFSFTFSTPGTYPYFCSIHPKMTGKVVVR